MSRECSSGTDQLNVSVSGAREALAVQISRRGAARAGKRGDRALIYVAVLASRFICSSIGLSVRRHAA